MNPSFPCINLTTDITDKDSAVITQSPQAKEPIALSNQPGGDLLAMSSKSDAGRVREGHVQVSPAQIIFQNPFLSWRLSPDANDIGGAV